MVLVAEVTAWKLRGFGVLSCARNQVLPGCSENEGWQDEGGEKGPALYDSAGVTAG